MIINEKELQKKNKKIILTAIAISIILVVLVAAFRPTFHYHLSIAVEFVCGAILAVSLGLLINKETKLYGLIFGSLVLLIPLFSIIYGGLTNNPVTLDILLQSYGLGFVVGGLYTLQALRRGHCNKLGTALKRLLYFVGGLISGIILIFGICVPLYYYGLPSSNLFDYISYLVLGAVFGAILFLILYVYKLKIGIDGSSVFVIGPPSSGKTFLAIGFWDHFSNAGYDIEAKETPALNMGDLENDVGSQSLSDLHAKLRKNGTLPRTKIGQLLTHKFIVKKYRFIPIKWIIMDYPGEKYTDFHQKAYNKALKLVTNRFNEIDSKKKLNDNKIWTEAAVEDSAETLTLINLIQEKYAVRDEGYIDFMESVMIVLMYVNFRAAGKIIFLIDGNQFKNEWLREHPEDVIHDNDGAYFNLNQAHDEYNRRLANGAYEMGDPHNTGEVTIPLEKVFREYKSILSELSEENHKKDINKYNMKKEKLLKEHANKNKINNINEKIEKLELNNQISKKIALVVTKTDLLCQNCASLQGIINKYAPPGASGTFDLSEIKDNKPATKELEIKLHSMVAEMYPNYRYFRKILEKQDIPTYFIAGSYYASARQCNNPNDIVYDLHPFGFSSMEEFGT